MTITPTPAEALRAGIDLINGDLTGAEWKRACRDFIKQATAALAAAPQPAPEQGMTRAEVGQMLDAKRHDREALVEVIRAYVGDRMAEAIADALLARGLRLPGGEETMACKHCGQKQRLEYLECTECGKFGDVRVVEGGGDE